MRKALMIFSYLLLFAGLAVAAYPSIYGAVMDRNATRIAEDFLSATATVPSSNEASSPDSQPTVEIRPYAELWADLWNYNESLYATSQSEVIDDDIRQRIEAKLIYQIIQKFDHTRTPNGEEVDL